MFTKSIVVLVLILLVFSIVFADTIVVDVVKEPVVTIVELSTPVNYLNSITLDDGTPIEGTLVDSTTVIIPSDELPHEVTEGVFFDIE